MGTWRAFGMVLYGKSRTVLQPDSFDRFIIEVDMSDFNIFCLGNGFGINSEAMVLCGDLALAGQ